MRILITLLVSIGLQCHAQITTYYSQCTNCFANRLIHWNSVADGSGVPPTSFTTNNQWFEIQQGDSLYTDSIWVVNGGSNVKLTVKQGGILSVTSGNALDVSAACTLALENGSTLWQYDSAPTPFDGTVQVDRYATLNLLAYNASTIAPELLTGRIRINANLSNAVRVSTQAKDTLFIPYFELLSTGLSEWRFTNQDSVVIETDTFRVLGGSIDFASSNQVLDRTLIVHKLLEVSNANWNNAGSENLRIVIHPSDTLFSDIQGNPFGNDVHDFRWLHTVGVWKFDSDLPLGSNQEAFSTTATVVPNNFRFTGGTGRGITFDSLSKLVVSNATGISIGSSPKLFESGSQVTFSSNADITIRGNVVDMGSDFPQQIDTVSIAAGSEFNINQDNRIIKTLVVEDSATLDLENGKQLTISDFMVLNNGSAFIVRTNASLRHDSAFFSHKASSLCKLSRSSNPVDHTKFSLWSSPCQGADIASTFNASNANDFYQFNANTQTWEAYPTGIMLPATGYATTGTVGSSSNQTKTFTGSAFNNGRYAIPCSDSNAGYLLVGNPYPSALNLSAFITSNDSIDGTVWLWNHQSAATNGNNSSTDYATFNLLGGVASTADPASIPLGYAATGQGFFVRAIGTDSVVFNNSQRASGNNSQFFKTGPTDRFWFSAATQSGWFNQLLLGTVPGATFGIDRGWDGIKWTGNSSGSLYSMVDTFKLAIQSVPTKWEKPIPIGITLDREEHVTFKVDSFSGTSCLGLIDKRLADTIWLNDTVASYTTKIWSGEHNKRFALIPCSLKPTSSLAVHKAYRSYELCGNQLKLKGAWIKPELTVYDLSGACLGNLQKTAQHTYQLSAFNRGFMIIRITDDDTTVFTFKYLQP